MQTVHGTPFDCHSSDQHAKCIEKRLISYKSSERCENLCCVVFVFCRATCSCKYTGQMYGISILVDLFILFLRTCNIK